MIPINKVTSDSACRTFLSNDVSFASFYNAAIFEGKQIIHPDRLVRYENDISFIINDSKRAEDKKRRRDIVVKTDVDGVCCLFSIEHQSTIDKNMVIRCGNYEMLEYLKQLKNKKLKIRKIFIFSSDSAPPIKKQADFLLYKTYRIMMIDDLNMLTALLIFAVQCPAAALRLE